MFVREDVKRKVEAIFIVNVDGTGLLQVTPWEFEAGTPPDWSPDGRWILLGAARKGGEVHVFKARPDGTGLTSLTERRGGGYSYLSSKFSPDGRRIVSARTPGVGHESAADVVVMNADGSNIRPITKTRLWESSVDWGPRG